MTPTKRSMTTDEAAQVGIGTMIVFIATVLVAAIAAGVLISTSSDLQEKSSRTGKEATEQVASNIGVESVIGKRDATTDAGLKDLEIYVVLAPGASEVDLSQLQLQISDGASLQTLSYAAATSTTEFAASAIRDADTSFSASNPVMTSGDLVQIDIDLDATAGINMEFSPRDDVSMVLIPEVGNSVPVGFTTPNSYGTRLVMELL